MKGERAKGKEQSVKGRAQKAAKAESKGDGQEGKYKDPKPKT